MTLGKSIEVKKPNTRTKAKYPYNISYQFIIRVYQPICPLMRKMYLTTL